MSVDRWINLLVTITLVEMMGAVGLGVAPAEIAAAARQVPFMFRAAVANYLAVPAAAVALLMLFQAKPTVAFGILVLAVCPGAPYAPPFTAIAKGNVPAAAGLMVMLSASSAIVAPLLLRVLLPLTSGDQDLRIDAHASPPRCFSRNFSRFVPGWPCARGGRTSRRECSPRPCCSARS